MTIPHADDCRCPDCTPVDFVLIPGRILAHLPAPLDADPDLLSLHR